ncbi:MAG: hypothetical protein HUK24_01630, partial [Sphaerochaetaceae bacterium]|nr:hypothetical protein [Sphaerochaetaceae bacterium]
MKRFYSCILLLFVALSLLIAQPVTELKEEANATVSFTDSSNRTVELPTNMTKIAPSGNVATMVFSCLAPEYMTVA